MRKYTPINQQIILVKPSIGGKVKLLDKTKQARIMEIIHKEGLEVFSVSKKIKNIKAGDRVTIAADTRSDDFQIIVLGENEDGTPKEYLSLHYNRIIGFFSGVDTLEVELEVQEFPESLVNQG